MFDRQSRIFFPSFLYLGRNSVVVPPMLQQANCENAHTCKVHKLSDCDQPIGTSARYACPLASCQTCTAVTGSNYNFPYACSYWIAAEQGTGMLGQQALENVPW